MLPGEQTPEFVLTFRKAIEKSGQLILLLAGPGPRYSLPRTTERTPRSPRLGSARR